MAGRHLLRALSPKNTEFPKETIIMNSGVILALAIGAIAILGGIFVVVTLARSDRNAATGLLARETAKRDRLARKEIKRSVSDATFLPAPLAGKDVERAARVGELEPIKAKLPDVIRPAMDAEQLGVTRRQFMNRGTIAMMGASIGGFGTAVIAFLWPSASGGFGGRVKAGKAADIKNAIVSKKEPYYVSEARSYVVEYPKDALSKAESVYSQVVLDGMAAGYIALYQKCVHLGCKVPWCGNSQWFECPCHGSQYNRVGEKKGGPAPRGLDHFVVAVDGDGNITIDTKKPINGPALGTDTTGQQAEGPHCVGSGGSH
jgi:cytochrome b6-f complex iron-sulfur subunit